MSKHEDNLDKYLEMDTKNLDDLDNLDKNVKRIVENYQSKDAIQKVLNAIRAEKHFLEQPDTPNTVILSIMTITIMIYTMFFDNIFKFVDKLGDSVLIFFIVVLSISSIVILVLLYKIVIKIPKENKRKNEMIKALHYIELELERICNGSEIN